MKPLNRDLLVLSKKASSNKEEMELEVEKLHKLLLKCEAIENFCIVNEIIDINSYKIISSPFKIEKLVLRDKLKPFQFINNKN